MNLLDFEQNKKVQIFLNVMFGHSMMPVINKPTRVTKNTATAIGHIFINSVTTTKFCINNLIGNRILFKIKENGPREIFNLVFKT